MSLASRLATTSVVAVLAVGSLFAAPAQGAPSSNLEVSAAVAAPAAATAQSSGTYWCTKGYNQCQQMRNYYLYLGCAASPIRSTWYTGWYVFDWRC